MRIVLIMVFAVALSACKDGGEKPARPSQKSPVVTTQHAGAGAKPGSHEDWCGEHNVPESLCTRCNPSLVAAFKASGDWCKEHDLPESQCLRCNPSLKIKRPAKAAEK